MDPKTPKDPELLQLLLPGVTRETHAVSGELLQKNHEKHNIFFNEKGFHNHLIHHILAAYSLGANADRLKAIYEYHASYQRQLPASIVDITRENFKSQLGNREAYTSYLRFFQQEIAAHGMVDTIRRFVWSDDMLSRFLGGALHPMIHVGHALEFDLPGVAAEGLAMAACTEPHFSPLIPSHGSFQHTAARTAENARQMVTQLASQLAGKLHLTLETPAKAALDSNPLVAIINEIRTDPTFDNIVRFEDNLKARLVLKNDKAVSRIQSYVNRWNVQENPHDLQARLKELYTAILIVYAASGIRKQGFKLDFFIMHGLTSSYFLHIWLRYLSPSESASLLRGHLAVTLVYYVSCGRPPLDIDLFLNYKSPKANPKSNNPWLDVFDRALVAEEVHVIKTVRACAMGQILFGHDDHSLDVAWLRAAEMTLDKNGDWDHAGIGFDKDWE